MKDCHRERHGIARRFCIGLDCLSVPDDHRTHYPLPRLAIRPSAYICDSLLNLCERVQRTCIKWDMNASFSCKICLEALFSKKEFQRLFFFFFGRLVLQLLVCWMSHIFMTFGVYRSVLSPWWSRFKQKSCACFAWRDRDFQNSDTWKLRNA